MNERFSSYLKLWLLSMVAIFISFPYGAQSAAISRPGNGNSAVSGQHFTVTKTVMTFVDFTYPCPGTVVQTGPEPTESPVETSQVAAVGTSVDFNTGNSDIISIGSSGSIIIGELPAESFSVLVDPNPFTTESEVTATKSSDNLGSAGIPTETLEAPVDPNPFTTASFPVVTDIPGAITPTLPGIVPLPIETELVGSSIAGAESTADLPVFSFSSLLEGIIPSSEFELPIESSSSAGTIRETDGNPEVTPTLPGLEPIPTELLGSPSAVESQDVTSQPEFSVPSLTESGSQAATGSAESTEVLGGGITAGGYGQYYKAMASDTGLFSDEAPVPSPVLSASNSSVTDAASVPELSPTLPGIVSLPVESPARTSVEAVGSERFPEFSPTLLDISDVPTGNSAHPTGTASTKDSSYFPGFVFVDEESQPAFEAPTGEIALSSLEVVTTLPEISQLPVASAVESSSDAIIETAPELPVATPTLPGIVPLASETEALSVAAVGGSQPVPEISPTLPGIVPLPIDTPAASAPIEIGSSPEILEVSPTLPGIVPLPIESEQSQPPDERIPVGYGMGYYGHPHKTSVSNAPSPAVTSVAAVGIEQQPTGEELEPMPEASSWAIPMPEASSWAIPMPTISASNSSLAVSELTPQATSEVDLPEISSVDDIQGSVGEATKVGHSGSYPMNGYSYVPAAPPPIKISPEATSVAAVPRGEVPVSEGVSVAPGSTMPMPTPPPMMENSPTVPQVCPPEQTRIIYLAAPEYYREVLSKYGGYKLRKRDLEETLAKRQEVKIADFACNYLSMSELCTTVTSTMTRTHFVIPTDCGSISERADAAGVAAWQKPGFRAGHH